ncbi:MAG: hypothetical protein V7L23_14855 [Nostoc sp.]
MRHKLSFPTRKCAIAFSFKKVSGCNLTALKIAMVADAVFNAVTVRDR